VKQPKEMARRTGEGGGTGPMNVIISAFIGLLIIVAIITFGPTLGGKLEEAQPAITGGSCSYTNTTSHVTTYGVCGAEVAGDTAYDYNVAYAGAGMWNSDYNTGLPNAATVWTDNVALGILVVLIFFVSLALYYIRSVG